MKVAPIVSFSSTRSMAKVPNYSQENSKKFDLQADSVSFEKRLVAIGSFWDDKVLKILKRDEAGLKELGEYFYNFSKEDLKEVARVRNFFGVENEYKSELAYRKLLDACTEVKQEVKDLEREISRLDGKRSKTASESSRLAELKGRLDSINEKDAREEFYQKSTVSTDSFDWPQNQPTW